MTAIENEIQYKGAMERIEELLKVVDDDTPTNDKNSIELVLLSNLVADYEDIHYPVKKPSLVEILKLRMFEMGITQNKLATILGMNPSKVSEILSGKSEPTLKQARKISEELNISPSVVLGV
ncbi:MAG: helix-turn-helix domain-containing protein [Bacteroidaceae bacterium]|jgi:HTH-type transcriptional regulator/antitoxin HigA|nr:helix-turn-helix domain-containing protein [Bacteroidaceae bacterium]